MTTINTRLLGRLLLGASLTLTAAACKRDEDRATRDEPMTEVDRDPGTAPAATTRGTMSADDVLENPDRHVGKKVRLAGEVDAVFDDRSFELEGDGILFDKEILVISRTPIRFDGATALSDDDEIVVEGTVIKLAVVDVERDFGFDLSSEIEMEYREKPIVVAESIRKVNAAGMWTGEAAMQPGMQQPGTDPQGTQPGTQQPGTQPIQPEDTVPPRQPGMNP